MNILVTKVILFHGKTMINMDTQSAIPEINIPVRKTLIVIGLPHVIFLQGADLDPLQTTIRLSMARETNITIIGVSLDPFPGIVMTNI